ncbi:SDR family oxidoreductase [Paeniglutamicibacter antarcticus]|uniref:SDR family oxidoreductase n=1 Tax=Arthrobacter terrae TaxID=2935737 RepID=A0A931CQB7_9MICC|nr:SDR family oxidoreductase [Arthrobacter terrae]MBG0739066.1 SDR family oxidoreductase [Arthrobacter terrae]
MARIAIIGGHGKVALELARILTSTGHQVSSFFRNPDHAAEVSATGATTVVADIEQLTAPELASKMKGHDAVVFAAGAGGGSAERTYSVDRDAAIRSMDAAKAAGVGRYVMISYFGAKPDHGVPEDNSFFPYAEAKAAADSYLKETDLAWTILAPSTLTMDEGTGQIETGADLTGTNVARQDVAHVAAGVLIRPHTTGKVIPFNNGSTPIDQALDATN